MDLQGLCFDPGLALQAEIGDKFGLPVSRSIIDHSSFILVVAFGRCKFRFTPDSTSFFLQATIGDSALHFNVSQLGDRTFKFYVSSKSVELFVANLLSFSCASYKLFFFLWSNGGPNWKFELSLYLNEEENACLSSKTTRKSYADAVHSLGLI